MVESCEIQTSIFYTRLSFTEGWKVVKGEGAVTLKTSPMYIAAPNEKIKQPVALTCRQIVSDITNCFSIESYFMGPESYVGLLVY